MTTAGFVSGTDADIAPTWCARGASVASLALGLSLVAILPALLSAAGYVAVLAAACAVGALAGGYVLWAHGTLLARTVTGLAAATTLVIEVLRLSAGLPGASVLDRLGSAGSMLVGGAAGLTLVLLVVDALRHRPRRLPERPYAL